MPAGRHRKLVVAGNSAGGHLALLSCMEAARKGIHVHACVLGYPAYDPADECGATGRLPFRSQPHPNPHPNPNPNLCAHRRPPLSVPWLHYEKNQSLLHWFFVRAVLGGREELLHGALPSLDSAGLSHLPPVLVSHGTLDSLVPVEHSRLLMKRLKEARSLDGPQDLLIQVVGLRHSFELDGADSTTALYDGTVAWLRGVAAHSEQARRPVGVLNKGGAAGHGARRSRPAGAAPGA